MVLAITCSFSIAEADRRSIHTMLVAALGCNLAWGLIDAVFHLIAHLKWTGRRNLGPSGLASIRGSEKGTNHYRACPPTDACRGSNCRGI